MSIAHLHIPRKPFLLAPSPTVPRRHPGRPGPAARDSHPSCSADRSRVRFVASSCHRMACGAMLTTLPSGTLGPSQHLAMRGGIGLTGTSKASVSADTLPRPMASRLDGPRWRPSRSRGQVVQPGASIRSRLRFFRVVSLSLLPDRQANCSDLPGDGQSSQLRLHTGVD